MSNTRAFPTRHLHGKQQAHVKSMGERLWDAN